MCAVAEDTTAVAHYLVAIQRRLRDHRQISVCGDAAMNQDNRLADSAHFELQLKAADCLHLKLRLLFFGRPRLRHLLNDGPTYALGGGCCCAARVDSADTFGPTVIPPSTIIA